MKKTKQAGAFSSMNRMPGRPKAIAGNLLAPQFSVPEPKSRILSWNWEPLQETYVFHKKVKGAA